MDSSESDNIEDSINRPNPVFLLLLDGWGVAPVSEANAMTVAKTPFILKAIKEYPAVILDSAVGGLNNKYLSLGTGIKTESEDEPVQNDLSAVLSNLNLRQLKIFDGERLAALSYYFNGRREEKAPLEDWLNITSASKKVSYDVNLSTKKIFQEAMKAVKSENYDFIVASCPVLDYLAATNDIKIVVSAVEMLDAVLKKLSSEILERNGVLIISSTHGNVEKMIDVTTDLLDNKMTNNPVPFIMISNSFKGRSISSQDAPDGDLSLLNSIGDLADIAPTVIDFLAINESQKNNFVGKSLII